MSKLIVIDGNSLMHRAYWALPSMTTQTGTPTGAVYGFMSMLLKLLDYAPDHLAVAFDMHGPTFRHETYEEYKAGRKPTPEDLRAQFPLLKKLLRSMGICVCECERYEADDILGTFSRMADRAGMNTLLVTGDRDALQLITSHTHVLLTKKGITDTVEYDEARLMEDYGLAPAHMPDLKGLMGDNSDNIPGIPGVGEKTALSLLKKYGTLEATLAHAEEEKGALRKKLMEHGELARMSYTLGVIDTAAPIQEELTQLAFDPSRMAEGLPMLRELELRNIAAHLPAAKQAPAERAEEAEAAETIRVEDDAMLQKAAAELASAKQLAIYIKDTLLYAAAAPEKQYAFSLGAASLLDMQSALDAPTVLAALKPLLENTACEKCVYDAKSMRHTLARYGIRLADVTFDAMLADYLLHAIHPSDTLETLCAERLNASADAAALLRLEARMRPAMQEQGLMALYTEVELPLSEVLFSMECEGFALDAERLEEMAKRFGARIRESEQAIYELAGTEFNILSPKQLGGVLFETLGLPAQKKTRSGYSTDAEVLEKLQDMHPIVPLIIEYRFLYKLKSTFIDVLIQKCAQGGRVHTSFNQTVTATGRISSTEPNLQNIPVRTELGREIRKAFVASPGNVLVGADYSQIELRLLAHMSGDAGMIAVFNSGGDIHARTASEVFGVPLSEVTREQRSAAKAVNFGIVYGISDFGLSRNLGISRKEAASYIELYLERYPGVREYMRRSVEQAREKGYACTLMGRRRELPELRSSTYNTRSFGERVAMNMPIQGTAADIIKLAMVRVHRALQAQGLKARLILQIHDELLLDTPEDEAERAAALLRDCMQNVMQLSVPLLAEAETGHSWYDTK